MKRKHAEAEEKRGTMATAVKTTALLTVFVVLLAALAHKWIVVTAPGLGKGECEKELVHESMEELSEFPFKCGLQEFESSDPNLRVFAYTQKGYWCWSNSGVVYDKSRNEITFIDVLTDIKQTQRMLDAVEAVLPSAIPRNLIYTHCDVDHIAGQQLIFGKVDNVYAAPGCRDAVIGFYDSKMGSKLKLMHYVWHSVLKHVVRTRLFKSVFAERGVPKWIALFSSVELFEKFDFHNVDYDTHAGTNYMLPSIHVTESIRATFSSDQLQGVALHPSPVPSHSNHDVVVHVPAANVHFTGDLVFNGVTPVMWAGTFDDCIAACQAFENDVIGYVVPGHGAIQHAKQKPLQKMKAYWSHLQSEVNQCKKASLEASDCAKRALQSLPENYRKWGDSERTLINVLVQYQNEANPGGKVDKFGFIAEYAAAKLLN